MQYSEFRQVAKDGDLMFITRDNNYWFSSVISIITSSKFTHVGFAFWFKDRLMIVDSNTIGGSRIVTASKFWNQNIELMQAPKPWDSIEEIAITRAGTAEYGWLSAVYIGIRELFLKWFNIKMPQDKNNRNKVCSELVAEVLGLPDVDISPGKLYEYLSTHQV